MSDKSIDLSVDNIDENAKKDALIKQQEEEEARKKAEAAAAGKEVDDGDDGNDGNDDRNKTDPPPGDEKVNPIAVANYKLLVEQGVLPAELEVKSFEDIVKHMNEEKLKAIEEWKGELPEDINSNIEAWSKGINYQQSQQRQQEVIKYEEITDEQLADEAVAKSLITEYHKLLGDDDEYIKGAISTAVDSDKLVLEAKRARDKLKVAAEAVKKQKDEAEANAQQAKSKEYKEYKDNLEGKIDDASIFWDNNITEQEKTKLKAAIFEPEALSKKDKGFVPLDKALLDDPTIVAQIHYLYSKGALGSKGSFNFLKTKAKSDATLEIEKHLRGEGTKFTGDSEKGVIEDKGMSAIAEISSNLRP